MYSKVSYVGKTVLGALVNMAGSLRGFNERLDRTCHDILTWMTLTPKRNVMNLLINSFVIVVF